MTLSSNSINVFIIILLKFKGFLEIERNGLKFERFNCSKIWTLNVERNLKILNVNFWTDLITWTKKSPKSIPSPKANFGGIKIFEPSFPHLEKSRRPCVLLSYPTLAQRRRPAPAGQRFARPTADADNIWNMLNVHVNFSLVVSPARLRTPKRTG